VNFRSDNESPAAPEILEALVRANRDSAHSYGADRYTAELQTRFQALFETDLTVYPVATGTAANALSLGELAPPYGAVYCYADAHINVDECGAPEFYSGGAKLVGLAGEHGRIAPETVRETLAATGYHGEHESAPAVLSLTDATEAGTVYAPAQVAALAAIADEAGMAVHMDGARFANALVTLGCSPADLTWRAGVTMLSFGATKNGAMMAEAVVDFRPQADRPPHESLRRRRMRGGHLLSKMRFLSAQLLAYVEDDLWLRLAGRANAGAARLGEGLAALPGVRLAHPVEANEVFVMLPPALADALAAADIEFHRWPGEGGMVARMVVPHSVETADIERLLACAGAAA
jgi:threonine aldolase